MYARKLAAEIVIGAERRAAPLEWLDSFCMRNFTGLAEFDDTLPVGEGRLEAGIGGESGRGWLPRWVSGLRRGGRATGKRLRWSCGRFARID